MNKIKTIKKQDMKFSNRKRDLNLYKKTKEYIYINSLINELSQNLMY